jgi:hypothetical protein
MKTVKKYSVGFVGLLADSASHWATERVSQGNHLQI